MKISHSIEEGLTYKVDGFKFLLPPHKDRVFLYRDEVVVNPKTNNTLHLRNDIREEGGGQIRSIYRDFTGKDSTDVIFY